MQAEVLVQRATAGRRLDRNVAFKPSLAYSILNNPYGVWCDLHAPKSEAVDETTRYERLRMDWGSDHEREWVQEHYPDAVEISPRWGLEAVQATARAMCEGVRVIYQPQLWSLGDGLFGLGDLLVRHDDAPSDLGPWHYRVIEIKRSKDLKTYQAVQAVFYNRILARLQGFRPAGVDIVLKDDIVRVAAADYETVCDEVLATWNRLRAAVDPPELPGLDEAESPWRVHTNRTLELRRDLALFPAITPTLRAQFRERLAIREVESLATLTLEDFQRAAGPVVGLGLWHRYASWKSRKPVSIPDRTLTIPRRPRALYYDFETCDAIHPSVAPHVYMIGAYDATADRFNLLTARGPEDEARIFAEFAELVGDPREAALYHWTRYETGQMGEAAARHPELADRMAGLIDASVDLHRCVKNAVWFGTRGYSIKDVAPFLGFRWRQADVNAYESMVLYWEWLKDGDPAKIARVATYNEDDCRAMAHVDRALTQVEVVN
jgi:predicted RecB family nuclease